MSCAEFKNIPDALVVRFAAVVNVIFPADDMDEPDANERLVPVANESCAVPVKATFEFVVEGAPYVNNVCSKLTTAGFAPKENSKLLLPTIEAELLKSHLDEKTSALTNSAVSKFIRPVVIVGAVSFVAPVNVTLLVIVVALLTARFVELIFVVVAEKLLVKPRSVTSSFVILTPQVVLLQGANVKAVEGLSNTVLAINKVSPA